MHDTGHIRAAFEYLAAGRGVIVRGLLWRSHLDRMHFSAEQNRRLADELQAGAQQITGFAPLGTDHVRLRDQVTPEQLRERGGVIRYPVDQDRASAPQVG